MQIRLYQPADSEALAALFYDTVHTINAKDYSQDQLDVWATGKPDLKKWNQSFLEHTSFVALDEETIVGFGDIDDTGYLDRLYVHKAHQGKGIATALCDKLETSVPCSTITVHASITARPFFEKRGYRVIKPQQVERQGLFLTNYVMEKSLPTEKRDMPDAVFEKICQKFSLGSLTSSPMPLTGGFLHRMYSFFTESGNYALKLLNPHIMRREMAMENYRIAEKLEWLLEQHGIPILPALVFQEKKMQAVEGQFFYLYPWYEGKALAAGEITTEHCRRVGSVLAQIHSINQRPASGELEPLLIDWLSYPPAFSEKDPELSHFLKESSPLLYHLQEQGNRRRKNLSTIETICHNDMDSKNVLWHKNGFRIIDLECLSYGNPFLELFETALRWSGYELCQFKPSLFSEFLWAYAKAGGELPTDWESLYYANSGQLGWLEYNLKRALGIDCAEEEISIGNAEAKKTLRQIIYYGESKNDILQSTAQICHNNKTPRT